MVIINNYGYLCSRVIHLVHQCGPTPSEAVNLCCCKQQMMLFMPQLFIVLLFSVLYCSLLFINLLFIPLLYSCIIDL